MANVKSHQAVNIKCNEKDKLNANVNVGGSFSMASMCYLLKSVVKPLIFGARPQSILYTFLLWPLRLAPFKINCNTSVQCTSCSYLISKHIIPFSRGFLLLVNTIDLFPLSYLLSISWKNRSEVLVSSEWEKPISSIIIRHGIDARVLHVLYRLVSLPGFAIGSAYSRFCP